MCLPFNHRYEVTGSRIVEVYGDGFGRMTELPTSYKTEVLKVCAKCAKRKVQVLKGAWPAKNLGL